MGISFGITHMDRSDCESTANRPTSSTGTGIAEVGTGVQSGKVPRCGRGWLAAQ